ncbi:MAG: hypothetical protein ACK5TQ_09920, partial [Acetobacteraceae bacterium]
RVLLDWGGGLVWIAATPSITNHATISAAAAAEAGAAMLFRAPEALRLANTLGQFRALRLQPAR